MGLIRRNVKGPPPFAVYYICVRYGERNTNSTTGRNIQTTSPSNCELCIKLAPPLSYKRQHEHAPAPLHTKGGATHKRQESYVHNTTIV